VFSPPCGISGGSTLQRRCARHGARDRGGLPGTRPRTAPYSNPGSPLGSRGRAGASHRAEGETPGVWSPWRSFASPSWCATARAGAIPRWVNCRSSLFSR